MKPIRLLLLFLLTATLARGEAVSYTTVQGIYNAHCITCHGNSSAEAGLNLQTNSYNNTVNRPSGIFGAFRVRPNFATNAQSSIYNVIVSQGRGTNHRGGAWVANATQKTNLTNWINQGALLNATAPTVTNVSPSTGGTGGGTSVTITGTAFGGTAEFKPVVTFGGVPATNVVVTTGLFTQITCTTPLHDPGAADVVVTTTVGGASAPLAAAFTFTSGPPSKLGISTQPSNAGVGTPITPSIGVRILDASNNPTNSTANVTLVLKTNPGAATLSGTTTVAAINGLATFPGISLDRADVGFTLEAQSSGLVSATTNAFNITSVAPTVTSPTSANVATTTATLGGNVTSDGGANISARGIVLSRTIDNANPALGGNGVTNLTATAGTGLFTVPASALTPGMAYSFAAYATTSMGTSYSSFGNFTTIDNNANLSGLVLSTGTLSPGFASNLISYNVSVPSSAASITITPTAASATASITGGGIVPLNVGLNSVDIVVTAQDNSSKTYTLSITRAVAGSSSTLDAVVPSIGTLSPAFTFSQLSYTLPLTLETTSVSFVITPSSAGATFTVNGQANGPLPLNVGSNTVSIVVTSEDLNSTTTYTVTVTRLPSTNANLAALVPSAGTLAPALSPSITNYTLQVPTGTTTISFTTTTENEFATFAITGAGKLKEGNNSVTILVTAQDATTTKTYTVDVIRAYRGPPRISVQPASQNTLPALLSVVATGQAPLSYQWLKSGKPVVGATAETFTATAVGTYSVVIRNALGSVTSDAAVVAAATMGAPQITTQPISALIGTGQVANFTVAATGNPTLLYQWRKVGSTAVLSATNTLAASAPGTYNVLIKNNLGNLTSRAARLGVVSTIDLVKPAKLGTKAILSVSATGDGLLYQWMKNGIEITGSNASTHVIAAASLTDTADYTCLVRMGSLIKESGKTTLKVYDKGPILLLADNTTLPAGLVSADYDFPLPLDISTDRAPVSITSKGLPPGLKIDPLTWHIVGKPTAPSSATGPFKVTLTARNLSSSDTAIVFLHIDSLLPRLQGHYAGVVDAPAPALGGSLTLDLKSTGLMSGNLTLGAESFPFLNKPLDAKIGDHPTGRIILPRKSPLPSVTLDFEINNSSGGLSGTVTDGIAAPVNVTAWAHTPPTVAQQGIYTAALDITPGQSPDPAGDPAYPQGYGFCTITVGAKDVKGSGKLADGTAVTFSSVLGSTGAIPVHIMLYSSTGFTQGWLQLNATDLVDGTLAWQKNPQLATSKNYNYKTGIPRHDLTLAGSKYNKTIAPVLGLTDGGVGSTNAKLSFSDAGLSTAATEPALNATTFRISNTNGVTMPANPANPATLTLKLTGATGLFTGTFLLKGDLDPTDTVLPIAVLSRSVKYSGVIVQRPGINQGVGHFLLNQLPKAGPPKTTLATSDILSGRMTLGPK